jgi:hypothetical protein
LFTARHLQIEQPRQAVACKGAQSLALHEQPILESGITNVEPIEQIAAVERRRMGKGNGRACAHELLELRHIDRDRSPVQGHELAIGEKRRWLGAIE